jgi:hypothetical protein
VLDGRGDGSSVGSTRGHGGRRGSKNSTGSMSTAAGAWSTRRGAMVAVAAAGARRAQQRKLGRLDARPWRCARQREQELGRIDEHDRGDRPARSQPWRLARRQELYRRGHDHGHGDAGTREWVTTGGRRGGSG